MQQNCILLRNCASCVNKASEDEVQNQNSGISVGFLSFWQWETLSWNCFMNKIKSEREMIKPENT